MIARGAVVCFVLAVSIFLVEAETSTAVEADADDQSTRDALNAFRQEMSELKDLVYILQEQLIGHQIGSEESNGQSARQAAHDLLENVIRKRRDAALSRNESDTGGEDPNMSRVLLGYHSTTPAGGTVYTHWGRSDCPGGAELVYEGTTAGSYYSHTGSGVNYLCLPLEPIYDEVETSAHASRGLIYSAEYETSTAPAFQNLHDHTPACAVCRAPPTRMTKLMIPGRNECPSEQWRLEYKGYLMSSLYTHKAKTDFICMDSDSEAVPGTSGSQDGALFYMVEARCMSGGGLPCGPYVNGHELTCAVCTI